MQPQMYRCLWAALLPLLFWLTTSTDANPPLERYQALMKQQSAPKLGLYNASDKVEILTNSNFAEKVLQKNYSALVEFYNSYCGHCKRFAPIYKDLAERVFGWRDLLLVGAIDCAADENNAFCREYEIMEYPTMRYFTPNYTAGPGNYGSRLEAREVEEIQKKLALRLVDDVPSLQPLSQEQAQELLSGSKNAQEPRYVAILFVPGFSSAGVETALHFKRWPQLQVYYTADKLLAQQFGLSEQLRLAFGQNTSLEVLGDSTNHTAEPYIEALTRQLLARNITEPISLEKVTETSQLAWYNEGNAELLAHVKRHKHFVYQADLELAVRTMLLTEVPRSLHISGDKLLALQRMLSVLERYRPLSRHGSGGSFIMQLHDFVSQYNQNLPGSEFAEQTTRLQEQLPLPVFAAEQFVGCTSSKPGYRGFTCSLWQLFHFLTVQATHSGPQNNTLEVLEAIHGYVKYFFGCTDCSAHFQAMAVRRKIWEVASHDEAVLWLWAAHNEVNKRLAGDSTEDPQFPKIQFPSISSCATCRYVNDSKNFDESNWNKTAVLSFLKNIHNPEFVSKLGLNSPGDTSDNINSSYVEKLRQKRTVNNVFTDMDVRVGLLLYGFCIVMMVAAFKLFVFKGSYRKKTYAFDLSSKA